MIVLATLDPNDGVPDALYEALHAAPITPEEERAGRVLRLHRVWLNGGVVQALANLDAIDESAPGYIAAYRQIGLSACAEVWQAAHQAFFAQTLAARQDALDAEYSRLTYGDDGKSPDVIEATVVSYAQLWASHFENAVALANQSRP